MGGKQTGEGRTRISAATIRRIKGASRRLVLGLASGLGLVVFSASAQTIIDEWANVKAPAAPELKPAHLDPKATALLMLDFVSPNCTQRPRCMASVPAMKKLLAEARAKGMLVAHTTGPTGTRTDIVADLAPIDGEAVLTAGVDKFANADLEKMLKAAGTQTIIATGTAAQGAVLYTASSASLRGMKVILPVDGMSSEDAYGEQYVAWHMGSAPLVSRNVTLTRIALIRF